MTIALEAKDNPRQLKVFFCRHGQTLWNQQGRLQGHLDSDLSEQGIMQAHQLAKQLTQQPVQLILSSDLGRAESTAKLIAQTLSAPLSSSALLRERGFGVLEGLFRHQSPLLWQAYDQRCCGNELPILHAETATTVLTRVQSFLDEIISLNLTSLVVICHGEWLRTLQNHLNGCEPWSDKYAVPDNCQCLEYHFNSASMWSKVS